MAVKKENPDKLVTKKKNTKLNTQWLKNATKSIGTIAADSISSLVPNLYTTTTTAAQLTRNLRQLRRNQGSIRSSLEKNQYIKFGKTFIKNSLQDLKSGKLYNESRDSFGGGDDEESTATYFGGDEENNEEGSSESPQINVNLNPEGFNNVSNSINKLSEIQLQSTKANIDAMVTTSSTALAMHQKNADAIISHLSNINNGIEALVKFTNENMNKFIETSNAYYEATGKAFDEKTERKEGTKASLVKENGILNTENFLGFLKKSFKENFEATAPGQLLNTISSAKDQLEANPIGTALSLIISTFMPDNIKNPLKKLDTQFGQLLTSSIMKASSKLRNNSQEGILGSVMTFLGDTLNITPSRKNTVDDKEIDTSAAVYDKISRTALVNEIPKYLRESTSYLKQLVLLNGGDPDKAISKSEILNRSTGKYESYDSFRKNIMGEIMSYTTGAFNNSDFSKDLYKAMSIFEKDSEKEDYENIINKLFLELEKSNIDIIDETNISSIIGSLKGTDLSKKVLQNAIENTFNNGSSLSINPLRIKSRNNRNKIITRLEDEAGFNFADLVPEGQNIDDAMSSILYGTNDDATAIHTIHPNSVMGKLKSIEDILLRGINVKVMHGAPFPSTVLGSTDNSTQTTGNTQQGSTTGSGIWIPNSNQPSSNTDATTNSDNNRQSMESLSDEELSRRILEATGGAEEEPANDENVKRKGYKFFDNGYGHVSNMMKFAFAGKFGLVGNEFNSMMGDSFSNLGIKLKDNILIPTKNAIFGEKKDGVYKNGIMPDFANAFVDMKNSFLHMWDGRKYKKTNGEEVDESDKEESITDRIKNVFSNLKDDTKKFFFGEEGDNTKDATRGVLGAGADIIREGFDHWRNALFGEDSDPDEIRKDIANKVKERLPDTIIGAGAGAILTSSFGGLLGDIIGGPGLGLILGGLTGYAKKSEGFQRFLFGEEQEMIDEDGNPVKIRDGGLISKATRDFFKKNKTEIGAGSIIGAVLGSTVRDGIIAKVLGGGFLAHMVGGPVAGAILGGATMMVKNSNAFNEFLYGKEIEELDENGNTRKKVIGGILNGFQKVMGRNGIATNDEGAMKDNARRIAGMSAVATGGGLLLGMFTPLGPVGGAILGLSSTILASKDKFHDLLFGNKEDKSGGNHGLLNQLKALIAAKVVNPMGMHLKNALEDINDALLDKILDPLQNLIGPAFGWVTSVKDRVLDLFEDSFDTIKEGFMKLPKTITNGFTSLLGKAMKHLFGDGLTKKVANVVTSVPGAVANGVGNLFRWRNKSNSLKRWRSDRFRNDERNREVLEKAQKTWDDEWNAMSDEEKDEWGSYEEFIETRDREMGENYFYNSGDDRATKLALRTERNKQKKEKRKAKQRESDTSSLIATLTGGKYTEVTEENKKKALAEYKKSRKYRNGRGVGGFKGSEVLELLSENPDADNSTTKAVSDVIKDAVDMTPVEHASNGIKNIISFLTGAPIAGAEALGDIGNGAKNLTEVIVDAMRKVHQEALDTKQSASDRTQEFQKNLAQEQRENERNKIAQNYVEQQERLREWSGHGDFTDEEREQLAEDAQRVGEYETRNKKYSAPTFEGGAHIKKKFYRVPIFGKMFDRWSYEKHFKRATRTARRRKAFGRSLTNGFDSEGRKREIELADKIANSYGRERAGYINEFNDLVDELKGDRQAYIEDLNERQGNLNADIRRLISPRRIFNKYKPIFSPEDRSTNIRDSDITRDDIINDVSNAADALLNHAAREEQANALREQAEREVQGENEGGNGSGKMSVSEALRRTGGRGYATGSEHTKEGAAVVGENGPEIVQFRDGDRVIPNKPHSLIDVNVVSFDRSATEDIHSIPTNVNIVGQDGLITTYSTGASLGDNTDSSSKIEKDLSTSNSLVSYEDVKKDNKDEMIEGKATLISERKENILDKLFSFVSGNGGIGGLIKNIGLIGGAAALLVPFLKNGGLSKILSTFSGQGRTMKMMFENDAYDGGVDFQTNLKNQLEDWANPLNSEHENVDTSNKALFNFARGRLNNFLNGKAGKTGLVNGLKKSSIRLGESASRRLGVDVAETAVKNGAKNAAKTVAKGSAEAATKSKKSLLKTIFGGIKKAFKMVIEKVTKKGGKAGEILGKIVSKLDAAEKKIGEGLIGPLKNKINTLLGKAAEKLGLSAGFLASGPLGWVAGLVKDAPFVAIAALDNSGKEGAARLFRCDKSIVDGKMRAIAAAIRGLAATTWGSVIDLISEIIVAVCGFDLLSFAATAIYKGMSDEESGKKLDESQAMHEEEYEKYKEEALKNEYENYLDENEIDPSQLSFEQYKNLVKTGEISADVLGYTEWNQEENKTVTNKIWDKITGKSKIAKTYDKYKSIKEGEAIVENTAKEDALAQAIKTVPVTGGNGGGFGTSLRKSTRSSFSLKYGKTNSNINIDLSTQVGNTVGAFTNETDADMKEATDSFKKGVEKLNNKLTDKLDFKNIKEWYKNDEIKLSKNNQMGSMLKSILSISKHMMFPVAMLKSGTNKITEALKNVLSSSTDVGTTTLNYIKTLLSYEDPTKNWSSFKSEKMTGSDKNVVFKLVEQPIKNVLGIYVGIKRGVNKLKNFINDKFKGFGVSQIKDISDNLFDDATTSTTSTASTNGGNGGYGGVPFFSQKDPRWANRQYEEGGSGDTLSNAGCGPTAFAMAASGSGVDIDPVQSAKLMQNIGARDDTGTNWNGISEGANALGISTSMRRKPSENFVDSQLMSGKPVILSGKTGGYGGTPYTPQGHYVVATGMDSNGNYIINDPNKKDGPRKYSKDSIIKETGAAWGFGGRGGGKRRDVTESQETQSENSATLNISVKNGVTADDVIKIAKNEVGYQEKNSTKDLYQKGGSDTGSGNYTKYAVELGQPNGNYWCASFVSWVFYKAANNSANIANAVMCGGLSPSCENIRTAFRSAKRYITTDPKPGDIVFFQTKTPGQCNHVGIVYANDGSKIYTIEGNSSNSVRDRNYDLSSSKILGYGRPMYDTNSSFNGMNSSSFSSESQTSYNDSSAYSTGNSSFDALSAIGSLFSELASRAVNGLLTGNYNTDWTDFKNSLRGDNTSSTTATTNTSTNNTTTNTTDNSSTSSGNITAASVATGSGYEAAMWKYLKSQGMTDAGAAAVMGNMQAESSLNPHDLESDSTPAKKYKYTDESYTQAVDDGSYTKDKFMHDAAGYGLVQWTYKTRKKGLYELAKENNVSIGDDGLQKTYMMEELKGYPKLLKDLKSSNDIRGLTTSFLLDYENPADENKTPAAQNKRTSYSQSFYNKYAGNNGGYGENDKEDSNDEVSAAELEDIKKDLFDTKFETLKREAKKNGGYGSEISSTSMNISLDKLKNSRVNTTTSNNNLLNIAKYLEKIVELLGISSDKLDLLEKLDDIKDITPITYNNLTANSINPTKTVSSGNKVSKITESRYKTAQKIASGGL